MTRFHKLLYSKYSNIILSIILGIGLATIFKVTCDNNSCNKYMAPATTKIESHIWGHGSKCYKYKAKTIPCTNKKTIFA